MLHLLLISQLVLAQEADPLAIAGQWSVSSTLTSSGCGTVGGAITTTTWLVSAGADGSYEIAGSGRSPFAATAPPPVDGVLSFIRTEPEILTPEEPGTATVMAAGLTYAYLQPQVSWRLKLENGVLVGRRLDLNMRRAEGPFRGTKGHGSLIFTPCFDEYSVISSRPGGAIAAPF